jgi:hypothetical protein
VADTNHRKQARRQPVAKYVIEYTKTEITRERVEIEADTPEEALREVEEYEFDSSEASYVDSLCWEVSEVEVIRQVDD